MEITKGLVLSKLPERPANANKGTFGSALIVAGSKNFPGAAILSCLACARVGVGLVTLVTDENVYKVAVPKIPFSTFLKFSEVEDNLEKYDSVLIGPGLGLNHDLRLMIKEWFGLEELIKKKLVLDADCLNFLSEDKYWFKALDTDAILTPHPKEMSRLTGLSIEEIQNNRAEIAKKFSNLWNKTIILKSAETVIANPRGEIFVSPFKNPLLATAGTGDVLSGMIAGLLAQGLNLTDAAISGVYLHGLAGEKLKERFHDRGATALDLVDILAEAFKDLKAS
ncbi:MAG TPA: NAD(P)H-hydrate dehydratase [Patescibacteria group bacterium]|nr:NAD(P)H-hydrate dehydratase [Patescibacteria group bacterium]